MRWFVGVLVLVGCASPRPSTSDGGNVAVPDGAVGPTPPCSTTVDLDGDGLGWECDPVEHISLANAPNGLVWMRWLADTTFAVHVGFNCAGYTCTDHAAVEVRPDHAMIRRSDSGLPEDAWLKNAMIGGPCIDEDHVAWWSSSSLAKTGTIEATGTFHPVVSSLIADCFPVGNTTALVGMSHQTVLVPELTQLAAPGGGTLHAIATADFGSVNSPNVDIGFSPPILAVAGQLTPSSATLVQAHPGDIVPTDVIVDGASTAQIDSVTKLDSSGLGLYDPPYAGSAASRFYIERGGNAYVVSVTATGVDWARLPRTGMTCSRWPNEAVACTAFEGQSETVVVVHGSTA
ncbi:MAG TPA: hypothetical protein VFQ65_28330, partial [Kofleriaceae bacterium]|nr:hypothetical protein [Kofleriaceae bacterium]